MCMYITYMQSYICKYILFAAPAEPSPLSEHRTARQGSAARTAGASRTQRPPMQDLDFAKVAQQGCRAVDDARSVPRQSSVSHVLKSHKDSCNLFRYYEVAACPAGGGRKQRTPMQDLDFAKVAQQGCRAVNAARGVPRQSSLIH